jgi:hypothetical protein
MGERQQITYLQTRITRMACREWGMPMREVIDVFEQHDVLGYIERNFGLLHMEGDDAVFDDVTCYLRSKGVVVL